MTTLDNEIESEPNTGVPRRLRRRRPAPEANPFFQFVFPVLVVVAGVAVFLLWREGTKAVLDTTEGEEVLLITDPTEPGFLVFVEPTPTMLIAHVDDAAADGGELVGVTVLARTAFDDGGSLTILSADMLIGSGDDAVILGQLYADEGEAGLERVVGEFFGFGFIDDPLVIDTAALELWLQLVEPIPFLLNDDLVEVDETGETVVAIAAGGGREFDAATLAAIYGWRNPAEVDAARFTRQEAVWRAWLDQIAVAEDPLAATLAFPLSAYLRSLGIGNADLVIAPMSPYGFDPDNPIYALADEDLGWPAERALAMVPLPIGHVPGARPTVQVLDGTGDTDNLDRMLPVLVAAGAEISVIGNAATFDVATTTVTYHQPDREEAARAFGAAIGAVVGFDDDPNQPVDVTVTIGSDVSDN